MRRLGVFSLSAMTLLSGCYRPTPTIPSEARTYTFTAPTAGQTFRTGDRVTISWSCTGCEADQFTVTGFAQNTAFAAVRIAPTTTNRSISWVAGTTNSTVNLLPGSYELMLTVCQSEFQSCVYFKELHGPTINLVN